MNDRAGVKRIRRAAQAGALDAASCAPRARRSARAGDVGVGEPTDMRGGDYDPGP
jgi:hypothetical protein